MLVGVCGGIAAYKICELVSSLVKAGVEVQVILTEAAQAFVTPLTFATLSRRPAYVDSNFWQPTHGRPLHIQLGEWAEVFVVAPVTANTLAKLTLGMSDNLLTSTVLASHCPILLAPAMNREMWKQIAVQRNWQQLLTDPRFHQIAPTTGILACDLPRLNSGQETSAETLTQFTEAGRMAEPRQILAQVESLLHTQGRRDLEGKQILISAGGTREHLDPVRFLGNPSTGKMGLALAQAALHRGASVTLVHAPMETHPVASLNPITLIPANSAEQMHQAMLDHFPTADLILMAAAVADVKPQDYSAAKLPKRSLPAHLPLEPVPDIVAELGQLKRPEQVLVGFAAQTGDILPLAQEKLKRKQLDVIVANPIDRPNVGFASEQNQAILISTQGQQKQIPQCSKLRLAHHIFDFIGESPE